MLHSRGQADGGESRLHSLDDTPAVLAFEHDGHAGDGFPLSVAQHGALPWHCADPDGAPHRGPVPACRRAFEQHDLRQIVGRRARAQGRAPCIAHRACSMKPPPKFALFSRTRVEDIAQREAVASQASGIDFDRVLPLFRRPRC